ncbi:hypothetical protein BH10BAC3_BH10BAC3_02980 [soil metagenome]
MLFFAGVFIISCKTEPKKETVNNDLLMDNLKGAVTMVESTPYTPDSTGKISAMDSCCISVSEYDGKGYIVKTAQKDKAGKTNTGEELTHFDNGKMKEVIETKDGKQSGKLTIELDSAGKYIAASHFDSSGKRDLKYDGLTEDMYGNILTGKQYNDSGMLKSTWKNDFTNNMYAGGESTDSTGKVVWKSNGTRNDKGDRITWNTTEVKKDSTISKSYTYTYESYDEQGNWIQQTQLEKGKATKVTKRAITYAKKE